MQRASGEVAWLRGRTRASDPAYSARSRQLAIRVAPRVGNLSVDAMLREVTLVGSEWDSAATIMTDRPAGTFTQP